MEESKLLSVIIPAYNEELVIDECYKRLKEVMEKNSINHELIFINDGSKDKTVPMLKELATKDKSVKVIDFSRNFGHQNAVSAGLMETKGDAVVIIDADLQDPPELIIDMIKLWEDGYDIVYGKRKKRKGESAFKLLTANCFYKFLNWMSDVDIPKDTGDFRLVDKKVVEEFRKLPEHNRFLRGMMSWIGYKQIALEYVRDKRFDGETHYPLKKMIKLAEDGIISFSAKPFKMIESLSVILLVISFCLLVYTIVGAIVKLDYTMSLLVMFVTVFMGSIIMCALGIFGEYILRIYDEVKGRPNYIVKEKINFKEDSKEE